jgi:hypothetical protein
MAETQLSSQCRSYLDNSLTYRRLAGGQLIQRQGNLLERRVHGGEEMASIALVVVETGSDWPEFVRGAADEVVALSQPTERTRMGAALERACGRAERSCTVVRLAVLACNADVDDESIRRRTVTASRLVEAVVRTAGGHFVLSARNHPSADLQHGLIHLAATLRNAGRETLASVSVRTGRRVVWPRVARRSGPAGTPEPALHVLRSGYRTVANGARVLRPCEESPTGTAIEL